MRDALRQMEKQNTVHHFPEWRRRGFVPFAKSTALRLFLAVTKILTRLKRYPGNPGTAFRYGALQQREDMNRMLEGAGYEKL
jgi:hypothetical protein